MVINSHREFTLGSFLPNHVLVEKVFDFKRPGNLVRTGGCGFGLIVVENRIADRDAFIADVRPRILARRRNQLTNDVLAFVAEGTA